MTHASSPYDSPFRDGNHGTPHKGCHTIASEKIDVDRKVFFLDLQENHRGRYIKITEDVGGRRDTIIVPIEAAVLFSEALQRLIGDAE